MCRGIPKEICKFIVFTSFCIEIPNQIFYNKTGITLYSCSFLVKCKLRTSTTKQEQLIKHGAIKPTEQELIVELNKNLGNLPITSAILPSKTKEESWLKQFK